MPGAGRDAPTAEIGVRGYQLDVADGGDVDPNTGRLLTIAELQEALRAVRRRPSPQLGPAGDRERWDDHAPTGTVSPDPAGAVVPHLPEDDPDGADPYDWDPETEDQDGPQRPIRTRRGDGGSDERLADTRRARRAKQRPVRARRGRSPAVRVAGRVLGFDWPRRKSADADWLPQPTADDRDEFRSPVDSADEGTRRTGRVRHPEVSGDGGVGDDFEVTAAPRGFAAVCWRWVARILLVVVVVAGVNQLFVRPFRTPGPTTAVTGSGVDVLAAGQVAARYAADYLSYVSTSPAANAAALTADLVPSANPSGQRFTGAGYVRADLVQTGRVTDFDDTHAVVAATVRLRVATPPADTTAPAVVATTSESGAAADPGPVPAGWTDLGSRWITLAVPVETTDAGMRVSAAGGVFSTEPPTLIPTPASAGQADSATVAATQAVAAAFFTGYAASQVSYLAQPGVSMTGLSGAVTFVAMANWSLTTPNRDDGTTGTEPAGSGVGVGSVTWQLTGTGLRLTQRYAVAMTSGQGRWYAAALSPAPTVTD